MQFPHALFKQAGLTPSDVATLCDVSRVTGWRWMRGNQDGAAVGVNIFLRDRVQRVTDRVSRALEDGALPDVSLMSLPPGQRVARLETLLNRYRPSK